MFYAWAALCVAACEPSLDQVCVRADMTLTEAQMMVLAKSMEGSHTLTDVELEC